MSATELAWVILEKCQQINDKGCLAKELLEFWGYERVEEVSAVIAHRAALVKEFEVSFVY